MKKPVVDQTLEISNIHWQYIVHEHANKKIISDFRLQTIVSSTDRLNAQVFATVVMIHFLFVIISKRTTQNYIHVASHAEL